MNHEPTLRERDTWTKKQGVMDVAKVCRALGDEQRLEIIIRLSVTELSVNQLSKALQLSNSAMSHKLRILRDANLVTRHKIGRQVNYAVNHYYLQQLSEDWLLSLLVYQDAIDDRKEDEKNGIYKRS